MIYLNAFLFAGTVCLIGQIILDNTKLTPGHVTTMFVVFGAFLDIFSIYDKFVLWAGGGALVPITSFGHLLIHGALEKAEDVIEKVEGKLEDLKEKITGSDDAEEAPADDSEEE